MTDPPRHQITMSNHHVNLSAFGVIFVCLFAEMAPERAPPPPDRRQCTSNKETLRFTERLLKRHGRRLPAPIIRWDFSFLRRTRITFLTRPVLRTVAGPPTVFSPGRVAQYLTKKILNYKILNYKILNKKKALNNQNPMAAYIAKPKKGRTASRLLLQLLYKKNGVSH